MPKSGSVNYVNVDELQAQTSLQEAAAKCGTALDIRGTGPEIRIDCPFGCPGEHSGRKEVAVNIDNPQKVFTCHAYGCQIRGNLLALMHGWLHRAPPTGGKLKGTEFTHVRNLLAEAKATAPPSAKTVASPPPSVTTAPPAENIPLSRSEQEAARGLATLAEKLVVDPGAMSPSCAAYVRRHPSLSPESMKKWQVGYLPNDGGGDKRGWSLRGQLIYGICATTGEPLAWVGRDPLFEDKEQEFLRLLPEERAKSTEPIKHRFPKGFHRGLELYGQQASRLREPGYRETMAACGLIVVEGFNDVIGLDNLGIPALGICSNKITAAQVEKISHWAKQLAGGKVSLLFDCEPTGDEGAKEALWLLSQRQLSVRLGWSQAMHAGAFVGRQPENLTQTEWENLIRPTLTTSLQRQA